MYSKFFTRLFLLIGMIGMFSVPLRADEIQIGSGNSTDYNLPTHSNYDYSLTQQIYTAEEIETAGGGDGTINSISFYNAGSEKTRTLDVYLANTDKASFANSSDWIAITSSNLVYSGSVTFTAGTWTTITFTTPFAYDGSNLAVIVDDNTGSYSSGLSCRTFTASSTQSIYSRRDNYDIDPSNPINGTPVTTKNQIKLDIEFASETCAKPKNLNATNITAHTATLTWTAGAEGQSNWEVFVTIDATMVPDENTTPTYQVTECSKSLSNLAAQTTYYAYVRSACGGSDGNSQWAKKVFATTREALAVDASHPYSQDFETNNDWGFANGDLTNKWCWGSATNNGGEKSMYVSKDGGTTYEYTHSNTAIYASKLFNFAQGTYTFFFDWNAKGENNFDYLRVALAPGDVEFTAGANLYTGVGTSALPNGWIALDGGSKLNLSDGWQNQSAEAAVSGTYTMVFIWRNDGSGGTQPPAAIDNISISYMSCPRPTGLTASNITGRTATLSWTENGTATNWVLQYATNNSFTENLVETNVSGTASKDLSGLSPETKYYARVKSVLGNDESSWSDVINFTTTATCEKPILSYVTNSNTAHSGSVSWTGDADGYELIYSTAYTFEPGDEGVTQINLGNVNTYTLQDLTPETTYRIKVRANCGEEDGYSQWSNQVSLTTTATCIKPTGLTASNVTSSSATITWTAGEAGQDTWNLQYKKASESEWQSVTVTTNSYDLNDLSAVSTYDVRVQADCGEGDLSQWATSSFSTTCGALELPYTYGFEDNLVTTSPYSSSNPFPKCWDRIAYQSGYYGSYTYYPYVFTATTSQPYAHGGNGANTYSGHSLRFYQTSSSTNECAVLPEISSDYNMSNIQIRFWAAVQSSQGNLKIGIMSSPTDANTFIQIEEINVSNTYNNGFQEFTVPFSTYTGNGRYIAFMCGTGSSYAYFLIDDITVEVVPTCLIPMNLEATVNSETETILNWTASGDETEWELEVTSDGSNFTQTALVSGNPTYTLTTTRATTYSARVRANCGDGDYSDWTEYISFTSDCGIMPVDANNPFFEDFENVGASDFPPTCWDKFSHEMSGNNYWYLNSNNSLDSSSAYSYWSEGHAFLVMPKMHIDGDANLSFDYLIGSGNYDESCSVVVSTGEMTYDDFSQTIWSADGDNLPSGRASATVSLSDYDGQDIYVAFKFKGSGTSGCTWYVDNVQVYVPVEQAVELSQGWNWWSPTVETALEELENALGTQGVIIKSQNANVTYEDDEWVGNNMSLAPGLMYKIKVNGSCNFTLNGSPFSDVTVTINYGSNWIGYPGTEPVSIEEALNGFTPAEGDIIKTGTNNITFEEGEWIGNINTLQPGQGYIYVSRDHNQKQIVFH